MSNEIIDKKKVTSSIIASLICSIIVAVMAAFVGQKVLSAQFEDYKKSNEERILLMSQDISEVKDDVKYLVRREMGEKL